MSTQVSPLSDIIKVSIPVTLSQYLITLGGFISVFFLSFLGTNIFAASMLISSTQLVVMMVPFAVLFCVSPMISHFVGEKKDLFKVGVFFRAAMLLSLLISLMIIFLLWNIKTILIAFHQPIELVEVCSRYFRFFIWVVPLTALTRACYQVALGLFKQKIVFLLSLLNLISFTICAYILILGKFGLPALGIQGLAIAYILATTLNLGLIMYYFLSDKSLAVYQLFNFRLYDGTKNFLTKMLVVGLPIALQMGNELFSFFITTIMVGWLGATALMAKQITTQYLMLLVIPLFGVGQASAMFVGKLNGEKNTKLLKRYGKVSISIGIVYSLMILLMFILMPMPFIKVFTHGENLPEGFFHLVSVLLVIVAAGQVFDSIRSIATGSLRGLGDTRFPLYVSFISIWVFGVPLTYLFGFTFHWGLIGIAMAHNIFSIAAAFILWHRWNKMSDAITFKNNSETMNESLPSNAVSMEAN